MQALKLSLSVLLLTVLLYCCAGSIPHAVSLKKVLPTQCQSEVFCHLCAFATETWESCWTNTVRFETCNDTIKLLLDAKHAPARGFARVIMQKLPTLSIETLKDNTNEVTYNCTAFWLKLYNILKETPEPKDYVQKVTTLVQEAEEYWFQLEISLWLLEYPDSVIKDVLQHNIAAYTPSYILFLTQFSNAHFRSLILQVFASLEENRYFNAETLFYVYASCYDLLHLFRAPGEAVDMAILKDKAEVAIKMTSETKFFELLYYAKSLTNILSFTIDGQPAFLENAEEWINNHNGEATTSGPNLFGSVEWRAQNSVLIQTVFFESVVKRVLTQSDCLTNARLIFDLVESVCGVEDTAIFDYILRNTNIERCEPMLLSLMKDLQLSSSLVNVALDANPSALVLAAMKLRFNVLHNPNVPSDKRRNVLKAITQNWIAPAWTGARTDLIRRAYTASHNVPMLFVFLIELYMLENAPFVSKQNELQEMLSDFNFSQQFHTAEYRNHIIQLCTTLYPDHHRHGNCMCNYTNKLKKFSDITN